MGLFVNNKTKAMSLTYQFATYAIKKGLSKKIVLILYSIFYIILYTVLLLGLRSNIAGLVVISIFFFLKVWIFNQFLKRNNF